MIPDWALTIAYWLHMLATVVWIGGLSAVAILVIPTAQRSLENQAYANFLNEMQRRLDGLGWFSLVVLLASGMFQMSASPYYEGILSISNRWSTAIFIKHILFVAMIAVSAYLAWGLFPRLRRTAMRLAHGEESSKEIEKLQQQNKLLIHLNLILAVLVLALTAIARAS